MQTNLPAFAGNVRFLVMKSYSDSLAQHVSHRRMKGHEHLLGSSRVELTVPMEMFRRCLRLVPNSAVLKSRNLALLKYFYSPWDISPLDVSCELVVSSRESSQTLYQLNSRIGTRGCKRISKVHHHSGSYCHNHALDKGLPYPQIQCVSSMSMCLSSTCPKLLQDPDFLNSSPVLTSHIFSPSFPNLFPYANLGKCLCQYIGSVLITIRPYCDWCVATYGVI